MKRLSLKIKVNEIDEGQPLARYLVLLFRSFENDLVESFRETNYQDITITDLQILHFVRPEGSQITEIAQLAGISKQAVGKTISSLEARNYLCRTRHENDGRSQWVQFTTKGKALLRKAINTIIKMEQAYQKRIGAQAFTELKKNLALLLLCHPVRR